jgi:hypothetical protein
MKMPSALTPYTETIKLLLAVALGCLILFAGQKVLGWREAAQQNEQRGNTMQSASGTIADGTASDQARQEADTGVAQGRDTFETTTEEDRHREPQTATRDSGSVPASRLRAFEQRRLARERLANDRLGRAGVEREARLREEDSSER